jgi:predicted nucleotidyltransferase
VKRWRSRHREALLVVDQLEELFTLSATETQARFAALVGRLSSEADVHVLLSLRDDFLIRCSEHEPLAPVFESLTPLPGLTAEGLRRAIVEPAKARGYRFEDEALIADMVASVEGARGALPLLAFAVSRLWEARDRERKLLTREAYEAIGGVAGALAQHAEATMDRIGVERQGVVREVFRNLVTAQGTRAVADRDELLSAFPERNAAEEVLRELIDARLVTSYEVEAAEGDGGSLGRRPDGALGTTTATTHRLEVVHESLLKAWPRLVRWQAQDEEGAVLRDQLKQAAHLWEEKGRTSDLLWTGTAFQEYELWRVRYAGALTALEEAFARAMREKARRRRRLVTAAVASVIVALAGVAIAIGLSRQKAVDAQRRGEASRLLTLAELRIEDDPTEALAFATASLELADSADARTFVMKALWEAPPAFDLPADPSVSARVPAFSPDGRYLAVAGHSETAGLWSDDGKEVARLPGHAASPRAINLVAWASPTRLVTGNSPSLHLWSVPEARRLRTIDVGTQPIFWALDSDHLFAATLFLRDAAGHYLTDLRSWELPDGPERSLGRVDLTALGAADLLFGPPGLLYAKGGALLLRPLPAAGEARDRVVGRHNADVLRVEGLPGEPAGVWSLDKAGFIRVWSVSEDGLELKKELRRPEATEPEGVWLKLDGRLVHDGTGTRMRLWDTAALPGAHPLVLRRSGSWYGTWAEFHPAGDWAVASTGGLSRLTFWPLRRPRASVRAPRRLPSPAAAGLVGGDAAQGCRGVSERPPRGNGLLLRRRREDAAGARRRGRDDAGLPAAHPVSRRRCRWRVRAHGLRGRRRRPRLRRRDDALHRRRRRRPPVDAAGRVAPARLGHAGGEPGQGDPPRPGRPHGARRPVEVREHGLPVGPAPRPGHRPRRARSRVRRLPDLCRSERRRGRRRESRRDDPRGPAGRQPAPPAHRARGRSHQRGDLAGLALGGLHRRGQHAAPLADARSVEASPERAAPRAADREAAHADEPARRPRARRVDRLEDRRRALPRVEGRADVVKRVAGRRSRIATTMSAATDGPTPASHFDAALREMVDRIVRGFSPRKIILFGSRARGTAAAESDVDLLVVTDRPGSRRQQAVAIDLALADILVAKDVLVVGVEELERDRDVVGTIAYPAWREGIVLYDRAA